MQKPSRTRRKILDHLKSNGPQDAASLAQELGVTAMAVRQHLYDLRDEKLVDATDVARPVGRPAKHWRLTEAADRFFPDAHADLAVGLIDAVQTALGPEAMEALIAERSRQQTREYRAVLDKKFDVMAKLEALAQMRTVEGYMASVEQTQDGFLFIESHCPICSAARACTGLCAMELQVFSHALGPDIEIERTDHILAGARRCAYRVSGRDKNA